MATDKSEPKVGLILKIAVLAIVTLVVVRFGLSSYFQTMEDGIVAERALHAKRAGKDPATEDKISASMQRLVKEGEKGVVHVVTSGAPVRPCWAQAKCDDTDVPGSPAQDAGAAAPSGDKPHGP